MKKYFYILIVCIFAVGCASHYKVTNTITDRAYYTKKIKKKRSGAISIRDERTGNRITLQSSEIEKISKNQFKAGLLIREPQEPQTPQTQGDSSGLIDKTPLSAVTNVVK